MQNYDHADRKRIGFGRYTIKMIINESGFKRLMHNYLHFEIMIVIK